jgi:hypothetical protein
MSLAHEGSTAISTGSINEGVVADILYVAPGANRLALLLAAINVETQLPTDAPVDTFNSWTLLGSANGGDAVHGADGLAERLHRTRIAAWWTLLGGDESGFITLTTTPAPNSITGAMGVYSSTTGLWEPPVIVSGVDTVHDTGRSVTTASLATQAGDILLAAWASDTEVSTAISAPTITQAGATLGAVTLRSRTLNSFGANTSVITADCAVTAGATAPVVAGFTGGGANCGPGLIVRLRGAEPVGGGPVAYARAGGAWVETDLSGTIRFPGGPTIAFGG